MNETDALVNIDFTTRKARAKVKPLRYIRIGTSGSLRAEIPVDSMLISSFGLGIDGLMGYYRLEEDEEERTILKAFREHVADFEGLPPAFIARSGNSFGKFSDADFHQGITLTAAGFYAPQGRVLRLPLPMPLFMERMATFQKGQHMVTNFEMETSAIYGLGKLLGHQCISFNAIVANRAQKSFSRNPAAVVQKLITKVLMGIA
jgi:uridine phosphorylase